LAIRAPIVGSYGLMVRLPDPSGHISKPRWLDL
jgi:hypothetical protein